MSHILRRERFALHAAASELKRKSIVEALSSGKSLAMAALTSAGRSWISRKISEHRSQAVRGRPMGLGKILHCLQIGGTYRRALWRQLALRVAETQNACALKDRKGPEWRGSNISPG